MAFDLATAKTKLSITDNTQDVSIQAVLDASLSLAEKYCDRLFMYASQRATFYHVDGETLQLRRFPVDQEIGFTPTGVKHHIHKIQGQVIVHDWGFHDEIHVDYSGGYKVLPADLELALWQIFDRVWQMQSSIGGGGGGAVSPGAISRITLQDVGTITYATAGASAGSGGGGLASGDGPVPFTAISILDLYRLESC